MSISEQIKSSIENSSWIRKMFEEGSRRIAEFGAENVFDFSIGNPVFEPPTEVKESLKKLADSDEKGMHRYMPNAGYNQTRLFIAEKLSKESDLSFEKNDVVMTVGAGGGLNVVLKTLLNPGDEVIVFTPYFLEYNSYIVNHGGVVRQVKTTEKFQLDLNELEKKISLKTKVVLINSPNNPTGVVYPQKDLKQLAEILNKKSRENKRAITLLSDEPYKKIIYQDKVPNLFDIYDNTIVVTSSSKDLALPGERIGYLAISPKHQDRSIIAEGSVIALRILGFVNAPAFMQRLLPLVNDAQVDLEPYRLNREILYNHLVGVGFDLVKPDGAFYMFPKSPIEDDVKFVQEAQEFNLLLIPGSGFGKKGYFRIAYCFETEMIKRSLPLFTKLAKKYKLS